MSAFTVQAAFGSEALATLCLCHGAFSWHANEGALLVCEGGNCALFDLNCGKEHEGGEEEEGEE